MIGLKAKDDKMHLYFITRGIKQQVDLFKMFMQTQLFKWTRKNLKTGKEEVIRVQGALRPIQLWEYVFPEECLDEVLTMLDAKMCWKLPKSREFALRKALGKGIKKIPKYKELPTSKYIEKKAVAVYLIGIKNDVKADASWGYEQEML